MNDYDSWLYYWESFLDKAKELKKRKMHDYNSGIVKQEDYYRFLGEKAFVNELHKKTLRLVSIYSSQASPETDSIEDSLIDLICYSADLYAFRMKNKEKIK